jgi:serine/threonine protein phosphatase PrpC
MAVDLIPKAIAKRLTPDQNESRYIQEAIREAVAEVNQEILGSSGAFTEFSNMGTTVVLAQFRNDRAYVAGIGDSRAYRLRDGKLEQLTKDHSLADALLDAGTITKEELPNHKFKNVLYLYLAARTRAADLRTSAFSTFGPATAFYWPATDLQASSPTSPWPRFWARSTTLNRPRSSSRTWRWRTTRKTT